LLILVTGTTRRSVKVAGALLLSPPAALLLVSQPPWSYVTQAGLAVFFFVAVYDVRSGFDMPSSLRRAPERLPPSPSLAIEGGQKALPLKHSVM
jgi:hypothetical protein